MKKFETLISIVTAAVLLLLYNLLQVHFSTEYELPFIRSLSPQATRLGDMNRCKGLTKWIVVTSDIRTLTKAMITVLNTTTDWCLLVLGFHISRPHWAPNIKTQLYIHV